MDEISRNAEFIPRMWEGVENAGRCLGRGKWTGLGKLARISHRWQIAQNPACEVRYSMSQGPALSRGTPVSQKLDSVYHLVGSSCRHQF